MYNGEQLNQISIQILHINILFIQINNSIDFLPTLYVQKTKARDFLIEKLVESSYLDIRKA